jgi:hypothetical protein
VYQVEWTNGGEASLEAVGSKPVRKKMLDKADDLKVAPLQSGKWLNDDPLGFAPFTRPGDIV